MGNIENVMVIRVVGKNKARLGNHMQGLALNGFIFYLLHSTAHDQYSICTVYHNLV
jgi:hypothetical protein